ncbi:MAG: sporulation integral membrane protein YtvI [Erysipelothrix sp.]|nr:sporulation integral membrane protein YtvI [Erysipelothrix sp.]
MQTEKRRAFLINLMYYSTILVLGYIFIKYFLGELFPFVLGFIIAFILKPLIRWITKKSKVGNKTISIIILIIFYALLGLGLFFAIVKIVAILSNLFEQAPHIYSAEIAPAITRISSKFSDFILRIDPETLSFLQQFETTILDSLANFVKNFSTTAISFLTNIVTKIPAFFLAFFFSIISSFFITLDYDKITNFFSIQFSGSLKTVYEGVQKNTISVLWNFFKAYIVIMGITFVESAIALTILQYGNAIGIAIIIAIVDVLPVLGSGTVLIPWAIIEMINGNVYAGIGLLVSYVLITVIRQIIEPRIVGDQIGLYPLVTLMCMYLGTLYFGVAGLFGVPILVTVLVKLQEDGIIKFYTHPKEMVVPSIKIDKQLELNEQTESTHEGEENDETEL